MGNCARCDRIFAPLRAAEEEHRHSGKSPAQICFSCLRPIPHYPGMFGAGFESRTVDHEHLGAAGQQQVWEPVMVELCLTCYRADQAKCGEPLLFDPPFHDLEIPEPVAIQEPPEQPSPVSLTTRERLEALLKQAGAAKFFRDLAELAEAQSQP